MTTTFGELLAKVGGCRKESAEDKEPRVEGRGRAEKKGWLVNSPTRFTVRPFQHIKISYSKLYRRSQSFRKTNNGDECDEKETGAQNGNPGSRWRRVRVLVVSFDREKIVAMPYRLSENESAIERQ